MKRWSAVLAAAMLMVGLAAGAFAQSSEEPARPARQNRQREPRQAQERRERPKQPILRGEYAIMTSVCGLSEEQQKKIAEIVKRRSEAMQASAEKRKEVAAARVEARKGNDAEAAKKAEADWKALNDERESMMKKSETELLAVLSDEQRAKWEQFSVLRSVKMKFPGVKFTDDQDARLRAAYVQHTTGVDLTDAKARNQAIAKIVAVADKDILTAEQRKAMTMSLVERRFRRAKLTEQQLQQIGQLVDAELKGAAPGDEKASAAAMKKLDEKITAEVLSDEQRTAMKTRAGRAEGEAAPRQRRAPAEGARQRPRPAPVPPEQMD